MAAVHHAASSSSGALKTVNFDSPRHRAAARMLGVVPKDLKDISPASPLNYTDLFEENRDLEKKREELFRRKRHNLITSIESLASKGDSFDKVGDQRGLGTKERLGAGLREVLEKEERNLAKLRVRAKHDAESVVHEELRQKGLMEAAAQKQKESKQNVAEQKKKKAQAMAKARAEAEKNAQKRVEARDRTEAQMKERHTELQNTLAANFARAEETLQQRREEFEEQVQKINAKRTDVLAHKEVLDYQDWHTIVTDHHNSLQHSKKVEDRLTAIDARRRTSNSTHRDRYEQAVERSHQFREQKRLRMEEGYGQLTEKISEKQAQVQTRTKNQLKELQKIRAKQKETQLANLEKSIREEHENSADALRPSKSLPELRSGRQHLLDSFSQRLHLNRGMMRELAQENMGRNERAWNESRLESLSRLDSKCQRIDMLKTARDDIQKRRVQTTSNCLLEKCHLADAVEGLKNASPNKMNHFLERLGLRDPEQEKPEEE